MNPDAPHPSSPARVLLVVDQPLLAELIRLALNHGRAATRVAPGADEAAAMVADWRPHLAVVDMDLAGGPAQDWLSGATPEAARLPVVALTRRGDLRTKLAAFDRGVDDILTVPFAPEELVARVLAVLRRTYHAPAPFDPVL